MFFYAVQNQLTRVSHLFPDIDLSAQNLRTIAVTHISTNQSVYENACEQGEFDYFLTQANDKSYWANEHLICALARTLKINIIILATHTDKPIVYKQKEALATVYACNVHNVHFYSMQVNVLYTPSASLDEVLAQKAEDDFIPAISVLGKRSNNYDPRFIGKNEIVNSLEENISTKQKLN